MKILEFSTYILVIALLVGCKSSGTGNSEKQETAIETRAVTQSQPAPPPARARGVESSAAARPDTVKTTKSPKKAAAGHEPPAFTKKAAQKALLPIAEAHLPSTVADIKKGRVHYKENPRDRAPDGVWFIDLDNKRFGIRTKKKVGGNRIAITILKGVFVKQGDRWVAEIKQRMMS